MDGELTEEDVNKIMSLNESEEDMCRAIISVPTAKENGEVIFPTTREGLEEIIRYNIEGNVNMISGKLHAKMKVLEAEIVSLKKGKTGKTVKKKKKESPES